LPWLPLRIRAAFLVWMGRLRVWLWLMVLAAFTMLRLRSAARDRPSLFAFALDPTRAPIAAAVLACVAYLAGGWFVFPHLPAGDEPHYLVMAQSLIRDHDLKIENNHRQGDYHEYF